MLVACNGSHSPGVAKKAQPKEQNAGIPKNLAQRKTLIEELKKVQKNYRFKRQGKNRHAI
jgi:hypothetical protein